MWAVAARWFDEGMVVSSYQRGKVIRMVSFIPFFFFFVPFVFFCVLLLCVFCVLFFFVQFFVSFPHRFRCWFPFLFCSFLVLVSGV